MLLSALCKRRYAKVSGFSTLSKNIENEIEQVLASEQINAIMDSSPPITPRLSLRKEVKFLDSLTYSISPHEIESLISESKLFYDENEIAQFKRDALDEIRHFMVKEGLTAKEAIYVLYQPENYATKKNSTSNHESNLSYLNDFCDECQPTSGICFVQSTIQDNQNSVIRKSNSNCSLSSSSTETEQYYSDRINQKQLSSTNIIEDEDFTTIHLESSGDSYEEFISARVRTHSFHD